MTILLRIIFIAITVLLSAVNVLGIYYIYVSDYGIFSLAAFMLIMIWINVFIGYFAWATNFYNLNYGMSTKIWQKIEKAKEDKSKGQPYDADILKDEPLFNPYLDQTFGLPPGTVRGMIAFSLLFGGTALLLLSFDMDSEHSADSVFRDQFEFFKTAFLMMVAFYFGTRSLKYLRGGESPIQPYNTVNAQQKGKDQNNKNGSATDNTEEEEINNTPPTDGANTNNVVVIDHSDPLGENDVTAGTKPPIKGIDPMTSTK